MLTSFSPGLRFQTDGSAAFQITNLVTHSTHDPPYEVSTINVGDPYYVDREYAYASLPVFMQYLNGIKTGEPPTILLRRKHGSFRSKTQRWTTANDDCPDPVAYDPQWICFDVTEPVRVFVLHGKTQRWFRTITAVQT